MVAAIQRRQVARGGREAARRGVDIQVEAVTTVGLPVGAAGWGLPTTQGRFLHRGRRDAYSENVLIGFCRRMAFVKCLAVDRHVVRRGAWAGSTGVAMRACRSRCRPRLWLGDSGGHDTGDVTGVEPGAQISLGSC